jgi:hypothetical protein
MISLSKETVPSNKQAEFLSRFSINFSKHYPKTGELIKQLAQMFLKSKMCKEEILAQFNEIKRAFKTEYIGNDINSEYREKCFNAFLALIMEVPEKRGYDSLFSMFNATMPEFKKAVYSLTALNDIHDSITGTDERCVYFSACFMYLILLEGLYDEVIWLLYLSKRVSEGKSVDYESIKTNSLQWFKNELDPVFFEGYSDRIRNAIAHAGFSYEASIKKMVFRDYEDKHGKKRRPSFEKTLSLQEFDDEYFGKIYSLFLLRTGIVFLLYIEKIIIQWGTG